MFGSLRSAHRPAAFPLPPPSRRRWIHSVPRANVPHRSATPPVGSVSCVSTRRPPRSPLSTAACTSASVLSGATDDHLARVGRIASFELGAVGCRPEIAADPIEHLGR